MAMIQRRDFLKQAASTSALLLTGGSALRAADSKCRIEVLTDEPIGPISPDLYGHFADLV